MPGEQEYVYTWGNNAKRAALKGRRCVIEAVGTMNTVLVRFLDDGERGSVSRRALRRVHQPPVDRSEPDGERR